MTKNGIIGLSISAIAVITGLTFYTDYAFNQQIENMISQEQQGSVEITLESKTPGMLSGDAQYKVLIPAETLQDLVPNMPATESMELYINHSHSTYPLFIMSEITLDLTQGTIEPLLHDHPTLNIEHLLTVNTNVLFQSNTTNLVVKPIEIQEEGTTVSIGKIDMTTSTNFSYDAGDFEGTLDKLDIDLGESGKFNLSGLSSTFDIHFIDGMMLTPNSSLTLNEINFVNASGYNQIDFDMKNLTIASGYSNLESDALGVKSAMNMASLDLTVNGSKYNVIDTTFNMTIKDIDKAGLLAIDTASKSNDTSAMLDGFALLLKRNIHGDISQLNTNINEVAIKTNGDYSLAPYEGNNLSTELSLHVMTNFTINYDINLSNNYAEVFPQFAPMIEAMIDQDFITADDNGNISTKLKMENGEIMANGTRIR